ncbi:Satratoxin biosynthesis SC1 cluster protein 4 [Colletotrichum aenigma]|uniref:Satratoxin biosynthesis SC1 cluster protein 4 n=1 Tax=Colletotrichum aenigma TaxID=1215731 RepID=UPI001872BFF9|nr:Satratoxin biosynthesis SC1 cluster protein 4 [Colletotrichum aenigma]KAF5521068.1 Satratoxin biosynthesis SC1 cluster protein 4 [Colletotrichum aenigma]
MAAILPTAYPDARQQAQNGAAVENIDHSLDGESRFGEIVAILIVGSVLSSVAVGLRAFTRLCMLRTFGMDDMVMIAAQALALGSAVAIGLEGQYGLGSHSWVPPPEDYVPYMKSFYSSVVVYNIAICLVKISILFQYRRIFANEIMQKLTMGGLIFMGLWTFTLSILLPLVCYPVAKFWDDSIDGKCLDYLTIWYAMAGVNLVSDFVIFSMPIPVIKSLQLPRRQKRMLLLVFGLGFFTCIISALRIRTLRVAADTKDPYWDNVDAATWSFLEVTIGILAACLPTLRPIFVSLLPRIFNGSSFHGKSSGRPSRYANPYVQASHNDRATGPLYKSQQPPSSSSTEGLNHNEDIEMGAREAESSKDYTVTVTASRSKSPENKLHRLKSQRDSAERQVIGQIMTTTVVTQEVTFERPTKS